MQRVMRDGHGHGRTWRLVDRSSTKTSEYILYVHGYYYYYYYYYYVYTDIIGIDDDDIYEYVLYIRCILHRIRSETIISEYFNTNACVYIICICVLIYIIIYIRKYSSSAVVLKTFYLLFARRKHFSISFRTS